MKMLRNVSETLAAKFPVTTLSYTISKNCTSQRISDAFSEIFELETSTVEGQSKKEKKERQKKKKSWLESMG